MDTFAYVFALTFIALAMAPAVAHALEFPGKKRLTREAYFTVQPIYYPGFTIAGIAEVVAIFATFALLWETPRNTAAFWLLATSLAALLGMQAVFWGITQPVNKYWLQTMKLTGAGARFFGTDAQRQRRVANDPVEWTLLRDRWEYSHITRAALATASLILVASAKP